MSLLGQASGEFTESSSALRILHVGIRNTVGVLTADSFTQTNPPAVATNVSTQVDPSVLGVASGSVCFARPDAGSNFVGGPGSAATQGAIAGIAAQAIGYRALGVFINNANGLAFENSPGTASGKGPYVAAQGTYGNGLFETVLIADTGDAVNAPAGTPIQYVVGMELVASRNGYLMPKTVIGTDGGQDDADLAAITAESAVRGDGSATVIGVLKVPADSALNELVYDQRI